MRYILEQNNSAYCAWIDGAWVDIVRLVDLHIGWTAIAVLPLLDDLFVLELRSELEYAVWFIDHNMTYIGSSVDSLGFDQISRLGERLVRIIDNFIVTIFSGKPSALLEVGDLYDYFSLTPWTRNILSGALPRTIISTPQILSKHSDGPGENVLATLLAANIVTAAKSGRSKSLSFKVIGGNDVEFGHSIVLDDFRICLPFSLAGSLHLICITEHDARPVAAYDFQSRTLHTVSDHDSRVAANFFSTIEYDLRLQFNKYGRILSDYLTSPISGICTILRPPPATHLGHQLWNELSGIEAILQGIGNASRPFVLVPMADQGVEIYGPIEKIFPELIGRVLRWNSIDWIEGIYCTRLLGIRLTTSKVTSATRNRLAVHAFSNASAHTLKEIDNLKISKTPIYVIGLRVENRTVHDLFEFLDVVLNTIADLSPHCCIVIDGHNSVDPRPTGDDSPVQVLRSHGQGSSGLTPVGMEQQLVSHARQLGTKRGIEVIDLIGASVQTSILWALSSDLVVAVWGAGLAKYRWASNAPTFIISNSWNLRHRADLHIYDQELYMDSPSATFYCSAEYVYDMPGSTTLISIPGSDQDPNSYYNFALDYPPTMKELSSIISHQSRH